MFRRVATLLFAVSTLSMTKTVQAQGKINKDHHDGNGFKNPWPSFYSHGLGATFKMLTTTDMNIKNIKPEDKPEKVDINWNLLKSKYQVVDNEIHATWLGQ